MDDLGIEVAFCTSERLYDHQREAIERVFGCPVANGYGSRDAGSSSPISVRRAACTSPPRTSLSRSSMARAGAAARAGGRSSSPISPPATSFIRYRTGDGGDGATFCACGRGLPMLREIQGRADRLRRRPRRHRDARAGADLRAARPSQVAGFRIVQESLEHTGCRWCRAPVDADTVARIARGLAAGSAKGADRRGAGCRDEPERSGKYRYVVSKVDGSRCHARPDRHPRGVRHAALHPQIPVDRHPRVVVAELHESAPDGLGFRPRCRSRSWSRSPLSSASCSREKRRRSCGRARPG